MTKTSNRKSTLLTASLRHLVVALFAVATCFWAQAAPITVKGVVNDAEDGSPLVGVSVKVKETNKAVTTNIDGEYAISAEKGQSLVFSYVGYETLTVKVDKETINIDLRPRADVLDEVVVVGYGTMKRSDITGATVSVNSEEIAKSFSTSIDQALQGRAAGVQVTQNSGTPGGGISVSIRGTNTFGSNEPLYIIDGVAVEGSTGGNSSALSGINPGDILSMEVLKDASATAIYGSRASNGVVIITTKRGEEGKAKLSYEGYCGWQKLPKKIRVMNLREFAHFRNVWAEVQGYGENAYWADPSILGEGTDWQDELMQTAFMTNHQLSVSGGSANNHYMISGAYLKQDGIVVGTGFQRFTARMNMDSKITNWITVGLNASFSRSKQHQTLENNWGGPGIIETAIRQLPSAPVRNPDGSFGQQAENQFGTYYPNPLEEALERENFNRNTSVMGNAYADISFLKDFNLRLEYGGNFYFTNQYNFVPGHDYEHHIQQASSSRQANNGYSLNFKAYINYNKEIGKNRINAMIGHESNNSKWEYLSGSRTGFLYNTIHDLQVGDATTAQNNNAQGDWAMESYFGRVNYGFDDRYLFTGTLRADGSSNFAKGNRWGWFPSVALAWRIDNEAFLKDVDWLNNLKLRLGWGIVGNQNAGSYAYGSDLNTVATVFGPGFYAAKYTNPDLQWERTKSYNVGLDFTALNNRIEFIFDAYLKTTDNLIMQASLPTYLTGIIGSPYVNAGKMRNKGFEFTINTVNISNRDFQWNSGLTFSLNRNKVTDLYTENSMILGYCYGQAFTMTQVGQPVGQFYGYECIGMFMEESDFYQKDAAGNMLTDIDGNRIPVALPKDMSISENQIWVGDYQWKDQNGDGIIDEQDRVYIGNPEPKFTFGFNNSFTYRDFDLNIFITGSIGNKVYNYFRMNYTSPNGYSNKLLDAFDFPRIAMFDPEGASNDISNVYVNNPADVRTFRLCAVSGNDNTRISDLWVEDGTYVRVKNISLGYNIPRKIISKAGLNQIRVYANVQNPFTITKYKGYDPEIGALNQDVLARGIDFARYPSQRVWTIGLNVNF